MKQYKLETYQNCSAGVWRFAIKKRRKYFAIERWNSEGIESRIDNVPIADMPDLSLEGIWDMMLIKSQAKKYISTLK